MVWLEYGCHPFAVSIFDGAAITKTYTIACKLRVASKCTRNCYCAKLHIPYDVFTACKCSGNDIKCGRVMPVRSLVENNGCDKSDPDNSEQCLRCDRVTPLCVFISNNACYHNVILS